MTNKSFHCTFCGGPAGRNEPCEKDLCQMKDSLTREYPEMADFIQAAQDLISLAALRPKTQPPKKLKDMKLLGEQKEYPYHWYGKELPGQHHNYSFQNEKDYPHRFKQDHLGTTPSATFEMEGYWDFSNHRFMKPEGLMCTSCGTTPSLPSSSVCRQCLYETFLATVRKKFDDPEQDPLRIEEPFEELEQKDYQFVTTGDLERLKGILEGSKPDSSDKIEPNSFEKDWHKCYKCSEWYTGQHDCPGPKKML